MRLNSARAKYWIVTDSKLCKCRQCSRIGARISVGLLFVGPTLRGHRPSDEKCTLGFAVPELEH